MTNTVGEGEVRVHFGWCSPAFFNTQVTAGHYKWFYMRSSHSQGLSSSRPVVGHFPETPALYSETWFKWNPYNLSRHPLLSGHQLGSLHFLSKFTVK